MLAVKLASLGMAAKDLKKRELELRKQFGLRLRLLRLEARLSQEALGDLAELEAAYISGVERAERNLTLRNIGRLADALNLPIQTLFDFRGVAK